MMKAIGVKIPKKIMPRIIGLIIIPSRSPNLIHNLLSGKRILSLTIVAIKNSADIVAIKYAHEIDPVT